MLFRVVQLKDCAHDFVNLVSSIEKTCHRLMDKLINGHSSRYVGLGLVGLILLS